MGLVSDFHVAFRNLSRNFRRTAVAVLAVGGGVVAFLLAGGFIAYIFQEMREATIHSHLGHIQVVRPGYFEKGIADPYAHLLPMDDERQAAVERAAGAVSLAPRLSFSGLISHGDATVPFLGEGVAPEQESTISSRMLMVEGSNLSASDELAVVLGEGLAAGLGVRAGDTVVLLVTKEGGRPGAVEVRIAGIFATSSKEYDDYALRLPIKIARRLMGVAGATSWVLVLPETGETAAAVAGLKEILPASEFEIVPWTSLADFYNKTVVLFSKQVSVVRFIIGLIIVLTISNTQMVSVMERTTEIGTILAIGLRRRGVLQMFLIEGAVIGIVGGIAGVVVGYVLAGLISAIGIPMPPPPGMAHGYTGRILVTPILAADALILAQVTALLASVMPAWKASRMNIVDALRTNQ